MFKLKLNFYKLESNGLTNFINNEDIYSTLLQNVYIFIEIIIIHNSHFCFIFNIYLTHYEY